MKILKKYKFELLSFLLVLFCYSLIFFLNRRFIGTKFAVLQGDMYAQYIPYYKLILRKIFTEGDLWNAGKLYYSFGFSLGGDISAQLAYYGCFSPFVLLYLFIDDINVASCLFILLKFAFAALFFNLFCYKVLKKDGIETLVGAILYVCSSYCVYYYFNVEYLDALYLLPLIAILIDRMIRSGKIALLAVSYAYLFITCFYSGYVVGIFSALCFITYLIISGKSTKEKIICFIRYMLAVALAFLLSMFILLPSASYILQNRNTQPNYLNTFSVDILDTIGNVFMGMNQGMDIHMPYIYCGLLSLLSIPLFIMDKDIDKKHKIAVTGILCVLIASCFVKPFYYFWHCFDYPDSCGGRFVYLITFLMTALFVFEYDKMLNFKYKNLIVIACAYMLLYGIVFIYQEHSMQEKFRSASMFGAELNLIFFALYIAFLHFKNKFSKDMFQCLFVFLVLCEVILNSVLIMSNSKYPIVEYKEYMDEIIEQDTEVFSELKQEDQSVYRIHQENASSMNSHLLYDEMSVDMFSSFENIALRKELYKLGYATSDRDIYDYGGTEFTKMLWGQKYEIYTNAITYDYDIMEPYYVRNVYSLSLGYMVDADILQYTANCDNPFDNQNNLASALTGEQQDLFVTYADNVTVSADNVELYLDSDNGNAIIDLKSGAETGALHFVLEDSSSNNMYGYLSQSSSVYKTKNPVVISRGGDEGIFEVNSAYSMPHIISMAKNDNGLYDLQILINSDMNSSEASFNKAYFATLNEDNLKNVYNEISQEQLVINEFFDGYLLGEIEVAENGKYLFLSIPYDKSWKVKVDGVETEIDSCMDGVFMAIPLNAGTHSIELEYCNVYAKVGIYITLAGVLVLITLSCYEHGKLFCRKGIVSKKK